MRIAIISDIHDNLINLKKCLQWCEEQGIMVIICCGDVASSETLKFLANKFSGTIHLVRGNADIYDDDEINQYKNIQYYNKIGRIEINNRRIGICHEPYLIPKVITKEKCDIVFYGHTHKPWIAKKQKIIMINPGTLGSMFEPATFAGWDAETGDIKLRSLPSASHTANVAHADL